MRARQWRDRIWAARLSLLALALNALVPVHLAFGIAEVLGAPPQCSAHVEAGGVDRLLLALLSGHRDTGGGTSDEQSKHRACPVCSALGALAGFAPPAPAVLSALSPGGLPNAHSVIQVERAGPPAAYRSRAPPVV
jgi:hypothetical protein